MMEPEEIFEQYKRNQPFYKTGGITVTGGEPLMQVDFLIDLFTIAKKRMSIPASTLPASHINRKIRNGSKNWIV